MAEEIDVDALLDAPFKHSKVVEEQSARVDVQMSSPTNAKVDPAHTESAEKTSVAPRDSERRLRRSKSRSRSSRSRHQSRRSHRDDDRYHDSYRRSRHDSPRDRDYDRDRDRAHDRARDRDYDRARDRDRYYDRYERRPSRRSSSRRRRRSSSPPRSASAERRSRRRSPSPEVDESERDLRTVFAMQLSSRLRRSDLVDFFSQAGRVRDAHIVSEKGSRRSRGVAYVEFYAVDSAVRAVVLSGQRLLNVPIIVQPSEAEKNRKSTTRQYSASGAPVNAPMEENSLVVVRELMADMEPADVQRFFDLFGSVEHCRVAPMQGADEADEPSEWTAYVKFSAPAPARRAVERLSGLDLFGTRLRVRMARKSEQEREQRHIAEKADAAKAAVIGSPMDITPKAGPRTTDPNAEATTEPKSEPTTEPKSELTSEPKTEPMPEPKQTHTVMLLKNMVNPEEETEENWREELEQDVKGECDKFGPISMVFADHNDACDIYVSFADTNSAENAQQSMDGRWFGGRRIAASLVATSQLETRLNEI